MKVKEIEFRAKIASGRQVFIPSRILGFEPGEEVEVHMKLTKEKTPA